MTDQPLLLVDHAAVLGGAELSLLDIATGLRERAEVALFEHGPFENRLLACGVRVHVLAGGEALRQVKKESRVPGPRAVLGGQRLVRQLAALARGSSLLYANSPKSFLVSAVAGLPARRPVIWHLRDIVDDTHFSRANIRLLIATANFRAARVIANSSATARAFVQSGGRAALVHVVHNGIDAAPFDAIAPDDRQRVRSALGIPHDAYTVGSFSRLHPWKGHRTLFDALEQLPGVHAIVAGGALFSGEQAYEAELKARAGNTALRGRVHMLGARDDVPELMAACDVIAHTSTAPEPFGRVIVEALLAGVPLVAAADGGVLDIVEDHSTAILTPPGSALALRDAIMELRDNPLLAARIVEAGRQHARANFSSAAMVSNVTREIDSVLAGARS